MRYKIVPAFSFDFLTPFYDPVIELLGFGESFKIEVLNRVNFESGEDLLDIGCGTGMLLIPAKKYQPDSRVVGIDPDPHILDIAKRKINKQQLTVKLVNSFAEDLPFNNSSFDVVVSTLVFHHLPTEIKKQAMKEILRVLKKNGRFLLVDFGKPENSFWKIILALEGIFEEAKYLQDNLNGKLPLFLSEAGFHVKEVLPRYRGIQFLLATKQERVLI